MEGQTMNKIYTEDPLVHYKDSGIDPNRTKAEIDAILGYWKVSDTHWHWKPEEHDIYIQFLLEETIDEMPIKATVKVACPTIWDKARPRARPPQLEQVNWKVSMRAMWWFIKSHLEMAYAMQSSKTAAFLPYLASADGHRVLHEVVIPHLNDLEKLHALPEVKREEKGKVIDV